MKVGLSIYSLFGALQSKELTVAQAIHWIKENGGEHMEALSALEQFAGEGWVDLVKTTAKEAGLEISAYCTGIDTLQADESAYRSQLELAKKDIENAARLEAKFIRCDLAGWAIPKEETTIECFDRDLPRLAQAAGILADYAKSFGLTLTVENHGMYVNGGERVRRLIQAVNRDNYRCTVDVGNALCVDENPIVCLSNLLPYAATVHFKDFYIRRDAGVIGEGPWIRTPRDYYLRGSIVGHGDLDVAAVAALLHQNNYDGYVAIEFEGMEDCRTGSKIGMDNVRRLITR